jgi:hypothetical protein
LNRFRRGAETAIRKAGPLLLADGGGEKFGGGVEVERTQRTHGQGPLDLLGAIWLGDFGRRYPTTGGAVPIVSASNIGFFDKNATPIALQQKR